MNNHFGKQSISRFAAKIGSILYLVYGRKKYNLEVSSSYIHQRKSVSPRLYNFSVFENGLTEGGLLEYSLAYVKVVGNKLTDPEFI